MAPSVRGRPHDELPRRCGRHPLAQAIVQGAADRGLSVADPERLEAIPGHGAEATVDGRAVLLGNRKLVADRRIAVDELTAAAAKRPADGKDTHVSRD